MDIKPEHLRALIEERYLERGKDYARSGMVEILAMTPSKVTARCAGTRLYRIEMTLGKHGLHGTCTCPAFTDFGPCKHMAATAYAVMEHKRNAYAPSKAYSTIKSARDKIERRLQRMTKPDLIDIIVRLADDDIDVLQAVIDGEDLE